MLSLKEFKSIKTDHLVNALGIIIFERIKFNQVPGSNEILKRYSKVKIKIQLVYNFKFLYQQILKFKKISLQIILRSLDL